MSLWKFPGVYQLSGYAQGRVGEQSSLAWDIFLTWAPPPQPSLGLV